MTDRADEIATEVLAGWIIQPSLQTASDVLAAALRTYADERLEEAAVSVLRSTYGVDRQAAKIIRSLKSLAPRNTMA